MQGVRDFLVIEVNVDAVFFLTLCLLILLISISYVCISTLVIEIQTLKSDKSKNLKEYLELATMDQILDEINNRELNSVILVKATNKGIFVDCFHIPPALSIKILETAADMFRKKIMNKLDGKDLYE